ncbi:unnamed protein product, partial [Ectocarpus sp. 13 AM-2016]
PFRTPGQHCYLSNRDEQELDQPTGGAQQIRTRCRSLSPLMRREGFIAPHLFHDRNLTNRPESRLHRTSTMTKNLTSRQATHSQSEKFVSLPPLYEDRSLIAPHLSPLRGPKERGLF